MKTKNYYMKVFSILSIIGVLSLFSLTSCSDSDEGDQTDSEVLEFVGYWVSDYEIFSDGRIPLASETHKLQFTKDGRYMYSCPSRIPTGTREFGWYKYDEQKNRFECESDVNTKRIIRIDYIMGDKAKFSLQETSLYNRGKWYSIVCTKTPGGAI